MDASKTHWQLLFSGWYHSISQNPWPKYGLISIDLLKKPQWQLSIRFQDRVSGFKRAACSWTSSFPLFCLRRFEDWAWLSLIRSQFFLCIFSKCSRFVSSKVRRDFGSRQEIFWKYMVKTICSSTWELHYCDSVILETFGSRTQSNFLQSFSFRFLKYQVPQLLFVLQSSIALRQISA